MEHAAFYEASGDGRFVSTPATAGPWDPAHQHAGPPSALIARAFEQHRPVDGQHLATMTVDILRPVPLAPLAVRVRTVRPGRLITLMEAEVTADGEALLRARGWRIARSAVPAASAPGAEAVPAIPGAGGDAGGLDGGLSGQGGDAGGLDGGPSGRGAAAGRDATTGPGGEAMPGGDAGPSRATGQGGDPAGQGGDPAGRGGDPAPGGEALWAAAHTAGYLSAMEWRFVTGGFTEVGPAQAWLRPRVPLVAGEPTSPACRVLLAADSGNGISGVLDPAKWLFVNVDLTVTLYREPVGEWVLLDAATTVGPDGVGLAASRLGDRDGSVGRGTQTLVVTPRR